MDVLRDGLLACIGALLVLLSRKLATLGKDNRNAHAVATTVRMNVLDSVEKLAEQFLHFRETMMEANLHLNGRMDAIEETFTKSIKEISDTIDGIRKKLTEDA